MQIGVEMCRLLKMLIFRVRSDGSRFELMETPGDSSGSINVNVSTHCLRFRSEPSQFVSKCPIPALLLIPTPK